MLFDEVVPAFLNLSIVLQTGIEIVKWFRDLLFFPLDWLSIEIFSFSIHPIIKSYFFIGILFWRLYNKSHLAICGMEGLTGLRSLILIPNRKRTLKLILWQIITWPFNGYQLIRHCLKGGMNNERNVYSHWIKSLIVLSKWTFIVAFLNFGYIRVKEQIMPKPQPIEVNEVKEIEPKFNFKRLAYLKKTQILDGSLYIENFYTQIKIGGINIKKLRFNGMSCKGEYIELEFDNFDKAFAYPIFKRPIIEFSYDGKLYRLTIDEKAGQFIYDLTEIKKSKMKLTNKYDD